MTKYIKPETTVIAIENGRLLLIYSNSFKETNEDLAKPNPEQKPNNGWNSGSLW